jgi:hypothetical protein
MRYELGFYLPEDGIRHSHRRENFKSYNILLIYLVECDIRYCFGSRNNGFSQTLPFFLIQSTYCTRPLVDSCVFFTVCEYSVTEFQEYIQ